MTIDFIILATEFSASRVICLGATISQLTPPVPFVIVVAGTSGAGKTSLTRNLAARLGGAPILAFDDYPKVGPGFSPWLATGADPTDWLTPDLAEHLRLLREGQAVNQLHDRGVLEPTEFLILEEPFGKSRPELAGLIDYGIYIEIPPEVALARRMIRDMATIWRDHSRAELEQEIAKYMSWYTVEGYRLYARLQELGRESCDVTIDGHDSMGELAEQTENLIKGLKQMSTIS